MEDKDIIEPDRIIRDDKGRIIRKKGRRVTTGDKAAVQDKMKKGSLADLARGVKAKRDAAIAATKEGKPDDQKKQMSALEILRKKKKKQ